MSTPSRGLTLIVPEPIADRLAQLGWTSDRSLVLGDHWQWLANGLLWLLTRVLGKTEPKAIAEPENLEFSADSFRQSWEQAQTGKTLPLSELWEGIEDD
jgi:hypothetical protein